MDPGYRVTAGTFAYCRSVIRGKLGLGSMIIFIYLRTRTGTVLYVRSISMRSSGRKSTQVYPGTLLPDYQITVLVHILQVNVPGTFVYPYPV